MFNAISRIVILAAYNLILKQQTKIPDELIKDYVIRQTERSKKYSLVLVDENPNNLDQVKELWRKDDEIVVDDTLLTFAALAERQIKNEVLRDQVVFLFQALAELDLFTDEDDEEETEAKRKALMEMIDQVKGMDKLS